MWRITIFTLLLVFSTAATVSVKASRREKRQVIDPNDCPKDCKIKPMDISFVVDASASIWPQNFTIGLNFIEDFVDLFDISPTGVRVSLVTYGEVAYGEDAFGFNQYTNKDSLKEAISKIPYRSGQRTNTSGGIRYMLQNHYPEARGNVR
ncbi:vWA domain-containing protein, partial [Enterococcus faecium]|uniref:vWA domain-containing protein n=1 Tax=Enterococcus faecium TaxID=1352 RepID=UPI002FF0D796